MQTLFNALVAEMDLIDGPPTHSAVFQEIIAMGVSAIPMVLRELEQELGYWMAILEQILGYNVAANLDPFQARDRWLEWGISKGLTE